MSIKLVHFGRGGHTEYSTAHRTSGYQSPASWKPKPDEDYSDCLAVDVTAAVLTRGGYAWVFAGPMFDPNFADGEVERCPEPSAVLAAGLQGSFKALLGVRPLGGLDTVGRAAYVEGWRRHGARIGKVTPTGIVWEVPPPVPVQIPLFGGAA